MFINSFWQLLLLVSRNKKSFHYRIALNKFLATIFLFAINTRVQHWLWLCKQAYHSRTDINKCVLHFNDTINKVLNGTFPKILPPTFKKVQGTISLTEIKNNEAKRGIEAKKGGGKEGNKKCKNENSNGNLVKNHGQPDEFKMPEGETWIHTFANLLPQDRPAWNEKVKMCARWHIKGNCYDNCAQAVSQMSKDNIPNDKRELFLSFMKGFRNKCKKNKNWLLRLGPSGIRLPRKPPNLPFPCVPQVTDQWQIFAIPDKTFDELKLPPRS